LTEVGLIEELSMEKSRAEERLVEEVARLEKQIFSDAWSPSALADSLQKSWNHLVIVRINGSSDPAISASEETAAPAAEKPVSSDAGEPGSLDAGKSVSSYADEPVSSDADEPGRLAGYALFSIVAGEAELLRIAVDPECRRKGIGRRLFSRMLEKLRAEKAEKLFLEVRSKNEAAIGLYRSFGMTGAGCRKNYYSDPAEDALIMTREIR